MTERCRPRRLPESRPRPRFRLNYAAPVPVQVVVGCAFQLWLLLAVPVGQHGVGQRPGAPASLLQGGLTVLYLPLIGRRGLGLSWAGATRRAVLTGLLAGAINIGANYAAFSRFVTGR